MTLTSYVSREENLAIVHVVAEDFCHTLDRRELQQLIPAQQNLEEEKNQAVDCSYTLTYTHD